MRASTVLCRVRNQATSRFSTALLASFLLSSTFALANDTIVLSRDEQPPAGEIKGVVDLAVSVPFDAARVTITVDGQKIAESLPSPYRVTVDFGPNTVEHKIGVTAITASKHRLQWSETINRGHRALAVKLDAVDAAKGIFEATVTAPDDDPVQTVSLWESGKQIASLDQPPYRFTIPTPASDFVQATARTKGGDEAADFWSSAGEVHVESVDVRTVPLYVSVIDHNGSTRADVDRSLFKVIDNGHEGQILEFGKAFDQPISIALLLDASASMTYSMRDAENAAVAFVRKAMRPTDRCTVFSIRDTPRREVALTSDRDSVEKAILSMKPAGRTSLYDAISSAVRELKDEKFRRAIVVLTDGGDNTSMLSFDEIDQLTKESGIPLYFVAYDSGEPAEPQDLDRMRYLAGETGGFVVAASAENVKAKYDDIEKALRAQYAILYKVVDFAKHNQWRAIRVVMSSPKLTARTIRGYFAP